MVSSEELPGFRKKRDILFGEKTTEEKMRETGEQFMAAGQYDDALEFFERCEAPDRVREIIRLAKENGNTPLFLRAQMVLGEKPREEELLQLARAAREAGRASMACVAFQKAGHQQEAQQLRQELLGGEKPLEEPGTLPGEEEADDAEDEPAESESSPP